MTTATVAPAREPREPERGKRPPRGITPPQRAFIARLCLGLLGIPMPETTREADAVIKRLLAQQQAQGASDAEIPF